MTQPEFRGFSWTQVIGIALGGGLVAATFALYAWFNRRTRAARRERPPQKTPLLRPPGYSLQCRIDELSDALNDAVTQAIVAGGVLGLLGSAIYPIAEGIILQRFTFQQIWRHPQSYVFLSLVALVVSAVAWIIKSVIEATRLQRNLRNHRFGLRGEQAVAEALAERAIVTAGYATFHDVPGDGDWNIDHVVVGPGGIFVLETKTRSRREPVRQQPENEVHYNGRQLTFPWCEDRKSVAQAERNAAWVKRFVSGFAPTDIFIQPVIVVPGWYVATQGVYPVHVMNAKYLTNYIANFKPRYTKKQLDGIVGRLDERCRDLEF